MAKPMKYRELVKLLRATGFLARQGKGDPERWSNGSHSVVTTQSRKISPGLVRQAARAIALAEEASE